MCFSTTASFVSGTVLTIIGITTIKKTKEHSHLLFAAIPFIFAAQQFSEGFVWLSLSNSNNLLIQQIPITIFMTIAIAIWPAWVPISIFLLEVKRNRKIMLGIISGIGVIISIISMYYLLNYNFSAQITAYHIKYEFNIIYDGSLKLVIGLLYLIPTVISHFVSSIKKVNIMGLLVITSYLITKFLFNDYIISMWCFFSAIISTMIYFIIKDKSSNSEVKTSDQIIK
jgi:hypothetical protein